MDEGREMFLTQPDRFGVAAPSFVSRLVGWCIFGFYLCLVYKLDRLGVLILLVLCAAGIFVRIDRKFFFSPLSLLSTVYVALATVSAFLVSTHEGVYRTLQFFILLGATATVAVHLSMLSQKQVAIFMKRFAILNILVFLNLILYHVATGRYTTWKYLYDTKSVLSVSIILLFYYEDAVRHRCGLTLFYACVALLATLILISGERKAYILFAVVYLLSKSPVIIKFSLVFISVVSISLFAAVAPPGSYVARQISSLISTKPQLQISEYYNITDIGDQSDIIRSFVNTMAREQFRQHPLVGIGATGYQEWAHDNFGLATDSRGLDMNVHGEINRIPVEEGIVGIAVALCYLIVLFASVLFNFLFEAKLTTSSKIRLPLYTFAFLIIYSSVEALDTFMLEFVLLFGYCVAAKRCLIGSVLQKHNQLGARHRARNVPLLRG
jgi:hypothetical protein